MKVLIFLCMLFAETTYAKPICLENLNNGNIIQIDDSQPYIQIYRKISCMTNEGVFKCSQSPQERHEEIVKHCEGPYRVMGAEDQCWDRDRHYIVFKCYNNDR